MMIGPSEDMHPSPATSLLFGLSGARSRDFRKFAVNSLLAGKSNGAGCHPLSQPVLMLVPVRSFALD